MSRPSKYPNSTRRGASGAVRIGNGHATKNHSIKVRREGRAAARFFLMGSNLAEVNASLKTGEFLRRYLLNLGYVEITAAQFDTVSKHLGA